MAALFLTALPFPLYLAIQIKTGTWIDVTLMLLVWAAFLLLFWLPLGFWLRPGAGRAWPRALIGLALSVPLGCLTVAVGLWLLTASLLPASLGFNPHSLLSWIAYGAPGPVFFLLVYLTFVLTAHGRRLALVVDGIAIFAFVAYTAGSMGMILTVHHDPWPAAAPSTIEITSANLVDTAQGTIVPNQDVTIRDGRIVSILPAGAPAPTGATVIPARRAYLMPGLIDARVHLLTLSNPFRRCRLVVSISTTSSPRSLAITLRNARPTSPLACPPCATWATPHAKSLPCAPPLPGISWPDRVSSPSAVWRPRLTATRSAPSGA
jgi:hypothetical protein